MGWETTGKQDTEMGGMLLSLAYKTERVVHVVYNYQ